MKKTIRLTVLTRLIIISFSMFMGTGCSSTRRLAADSHTDKTVEILAVNDMHAYIDNFPRLAFMVDSLRALYPNLLLISGGDNQTGNPINDQYPEKGMPIIELMNALKFDLSAIGNHEFDSKPDGFARITNRAKFNFLCANLTPPANSDFRISPYKIITLPNGVKIALVGLLHINARGIPDTHPDNVTGFSFTDPFETATHYLSLRDSSQVLVFLNHIGFENDVLLANQLPHNAIDLIIGAHSHTRVEKEQMHNGILITQAERRLKYATLIKLKVKPDGKVVEREMKLLTVGNKGSERSDIRTMVNEFNDNPVLKASIAVADDDFTSAEQVGYLMADALRAGAKAEIAFVNPGGVRVEHLPKGNISPLNVYSMDPFGNDITLFNLTGVEIRRMLIFAYKFDEFLPLYPSGIKSRYLINSDGNAEDVQLFNYDNTPLDMKRKYTVAINNYMATVYDFEHQDSGTGLFRPTAESMIEYLRNQKQIASYRNEKRVEIIKQ